MPLALVFLQVKIWGSAQALALTVPVGVRALGQVVEQGYSDPVAVLALDQAVVLVWVPASGQVVAWGLDRAAVGALGQAVVLVSVSVSCQVVARGLDQAAVAASGQAAVGALGQVVV